MIKYKHKHQLRIFLVTITIMITMIVATSTLINYLEGDIIPDSSPWSLI